MDFRDEKVFQNEIQHNTSLQKDICSLLDIDFDKCKFVSEDTYINRITADFSIFEMVKLRLLWSARVVILVLMNMFAV